MDKQSEVYPSLLVRVWAIAEAERGDWERPLTFRRRASSEAPRPRSSSHRGCFLPRHRHGDVVEDVYPRFARETPDPVANRERPADRQGCGEIWIREPYRAAKARRVQRRETKEPDVKHQESRGVPRRASLASHVRRARVGNERTRPRRGAEERPRARLGDEQNVRL